MSNYRIFILSLFLLSVVASCRDVKINPYEDETGIFSVYGAMDLHDSVNVIRVRDLNTFFNSDSSKYLDATVTFYDLNNGTSQVLQDSIVEFPANYTHNFILHKQLEPRSPYRVVVERSDGESVSSEFTTPGITTANAWPNEKVLCSRYIQLSFRNVTSSEQIRWEVGFNHNNKMHWLELSGYCNHSYRADRNEYVIEVSPLELLAMVFPAKGVSNTCGEPFFWPEFYCKDLTSNKVTIRYTHLGAEWKSVYPVRSIDPVQVGDIFNGLGFLGSFRRDTFSFTVSRD